MPNKSYKLSVLREKEIQMILLLLKFDCILYFKHGIILAGSGRNA